ncbi:hypothetical protein ACSAZK_12815 [Methanosarcina sp. Mfa9]|uniref:hypothetical protein n=1 Tax=Methanosarcina sp. Mfa9 TaxID=3439063 RepID=UPI003F83E436
MKLICSKYKSLHGSRNSEKTKTYILIMFCKIGETGHFQGCLQGLGMKYPFQSANFAARGIMGKKPYDNLAKAKLIKKYNTQKGTGLFLKRWALWLIHVQIIYLQPARGPLNY